MVGVPPTAGQTLDSVRVEAVLADALAEAERRRLAARRSTPFLLAAVAERTAGESVEANLALLENNARVGAEIAIAFCQR